MKYFQITNTNQVNGYLDTDTVGIDYAISQGWQEVTDTFIP